MTKIGHIEQQNSASHAHTFQHVGLYVEPQRSHQISRFDMLSPDGEWLERRGGSIDDYAFPSRVDHTGHLSTRQYA